MGNVLVILADDLGYEDLAAAGKAGWTPNVNALAANGVVYQNCFANPTCSPTRDGVLTSRWGGKLDGTPCVPVSGHEIPLDIPTLPRLVEKTHSTGLFGKWHLGRDPGGIAALPNIPELYGFDFWCGIAANPIECGSHSYTDWQHVHGGDSSPSKEYLPRVVLDHLKDWWTETSGEKLALWACSLPHGPLHRPPDEELPATYPSTSTSREKYEAMIATWDMHVGEMLAVIDLDETLVIVMGDNGTPSNVAPTGLGSKAKGTAYDRGIHVPCIVVAPGLSSGLATRMVHPVDVLPTVAEYLGVEAPEGLVGVSMGAPPNVRPYVIAIDYFGEVFPVSSTACIRTSTHKLMIVDWHSASPEERFYHLVTDPEETTPLGAASFPAIQSQLRTALLDALPD